MNDLTDLRIFISSLLRPIINEAIKEHLGTQKEDTSQKVQFFSPKEFAHLTGLKYSTIIYKAKTGALKARQDGPSCSWQISATELDRFKNEANENI